MQFSRTLLDRFNKSIDELQSELGGPPTFAIVMQRAGEPEADAMLRAKQDGAAMIVMVRRFCDDAKPPEP